MLKFYFWIVLLLNFEALLNAWEENKICQEAVDKGPCFSALQYETQVEAVEGKSETCKKYLEELLSKCSWRNTTYTAAGCHAHCNANDTSVCDRIWNWDPEKCSSGVPRYSYSPTTKCKQLKFGGCLGTANNFATPQECANSCSPPETKKRRSILRSYHKRMKKIIDQARLISISQLYK